MFELTAAERLNRVKVLHVGAGCGFGGAETVTASLVGSQQRRGIRADVFFYIDSGGAIQFRDLCEVWFAHQYPLAEVILSGGYDLIHIVGAAVPRAERNLRQAMYKGAVVLTSHGWFGSSMNCDYVTAVSKFGADEIQDRCPKPVYVVYNGIDITRFHPPLERKDERPVIAWVGRASDPQKDPSGLTALAASGMIDDFHVVVADGSPGESGLENWLPANCTIIKQLPWHEMPDYYRSVAASGGFLLSTAQVEWCPMNILEAQSCGCPVIAPAVGGIPEIILHKSTGYVYDKRNGLSAIKDGLKWLYEQSNYEQVSGAASNYIAENFTVEKMCDEYMEIYEQALMHRRTTGANRLVQKFMLAGIRSLRAARVIQH